MITNPSSATAVPLQLELDLFGSAHPTSPREQCSDRAVPSEHLRQLVFEYVSDSRLILTDAQLDQLDKFARWLLLRASYLEVSTREGLALAVTLTLYPPQHDKTP